jgi:hypothetical protein
MQLQDGESQMQGGVSPPAAAIAACNCTSHPWRRVVYAA